MKAVMLQETGQVAVVEHETPRLGANDVLIEVAYAGICGSDMHAFRGRHPFREPPVVLGHEVSGTVAAMGSDVDDFSLGDRVTVMPVVSCGHCTFCERGLPNLCVNKEVPGTGDWLGTMADYFRADAGITYKLGENTSLRPGCLAEPLAVAAHAVAQGKVRTGSRVLVLGGGTIGLLTALSAKILGAETVVLTDLYDYNLEIAKAMGIDDRRSARQEDLDRALLQDYPEKFETVLLASGAPPVMEQAINLVQRGGRIVVTALFLDETPVDLLQVTLQELQVVGSQIYTSKDFEAALRWLDAGRWPFEKVISHVYPLDQAPEVFQNVARHPENAIKVLLAGPGATL
ncbi:MAG: alcohol dehydrogenase catalytic domain-containing protein [Chloroflexota bacterium]|nr:alcohol dehydrogenase catalytic domain-containing protein [Chloroflexota bacterium]